MGFSRWKKVRDALGFAACTVPVKDDDDSNQVNTNVNDLSFKSRRPFAVSVVSRGADLDAVTEARSPLRRFRNGGRHSRTACAICLESMKPGNGHAIFTAECSHTFHFNCIASNVRHGNLFCPVCRAAWKEVPWQAPVAETSKAQETTPRPARQMTPRQQEALQKAEEEQRRMEPVLRILDESIATFRTNRTADIPDEPVTYDDDDVFETTTSQVRSSGTATQPTMEITLHPEIEAVASANACDVMVLVHLKALSRSQPLIPVSGTRAAIDLVTVLDVSGSMSGNKLMLVKRAMGFVINTLSTSDRLSVVVFSSSARRVFPLRRMTGDGRRSAKRLVEKLTCNGGTNISEGLTKGTRVLTERRYRNPVTGIMLLSDGQDTCSMTPRRSLSAFPVHAFGFGTDHDAGALHRISEDSGGTFSFIQSDLLLQDAFALCLGGLLTVAAQDVNISITPHAPVRLLSIQAGSYKTDMQSGIVSLGDLYADEERHVLVDLRVPSTKSLSTEAMSVTVNYRIPLTQESAQMTPKTVSISRPDVVHGHNSVPNVEVERQKNRLRTGQAIADARGLADRYKLAEAHEVLQRAKGALLQTRDESWRSLESELSEIEARMANLQTYESSGRAYVLSAQNCHMRQRATTRGESIDNLSREYQTPSMVNMISLSQTIGMDNNINDQHPNHASNSQQASSAWKLAKAAVLRKPSTKVSDLHGFEKAGF